MMTSPEMTTLAGDLAAALDPVIFAGRAGIAPDAWQQEVLRAPDTRILMLCSRQSGKSTVAAILALHRATFFPGSLVLLLSPSLRQSGELFRVVARLQAAAGGAPVTEQSSLRLEMANGSRVISLPGSEATVRGFAGVNLVIVDEAARVPDELFHAINPMLATTDGTMICLSTPFGKRGFFSETWHGSGPWKRVKVRAADCPRISPAFLAEQRATLGAWWFAQEYDVEFLDSDSSAFRSVDIDAAQTGEVVELWRL
jgi:hypothetical protein